MGAYRWVAKNAPGADLSNLSPSAIYSLSVSDYPPDTVAAVLQEAKDKRVGQDRVWQIHSQLTLQSKPEPNNQIVTLNGQQVDLSKLGAAARAQLQAEARTEAEAKAKADTAEPELDPDLAAERRRHNANSASGDASLHLTGIIQACYEYVIDLSPIEIERARKVFEQCAREAKKRAANRAAAEVTVTGHAA
jgi:hypothetical protein